MQDKRCNNLPIKGWFRIKLFPELAIVLPGSSGTPVIIEEPTHSRVGSQTPAELISRLFPLILAFAGIILFIMLLWGGFNMMFSGGDVKKVQDAKQKVTSAIIGFVIVFSAFFITQAVLFILGI